MCLSIAHGANNARTSVGVFAMMLAVHNTGAVPETVELMWAWRVMPAVGMSLGTLLLGFRLTPVSGEAAHLEQRHNYMVKVWVYMVKVWVYMGRHAMETLSTQQQFKIASDAVVLGSYLYNFPFCECVPI